MVYSSDTIRHLESHLPLFAGLAAGLVAAGVLLALQAGGGAAAGIWSLPEGDGVSVWRILGRTALISTGLLVLFIAAMSPGGHWRTAALAGLWLIAAGASLALTFGRPGGDSLANLAAHAALRPEQGHLYVGGEFLGHLWFVPWLATGPDDPASALLGAARLAGWIGLAGLLACAGRLTGGLPTAPSRGAAAATACAIPYAILLLGYPQSTALMSALVPCYLAAGLAALQPGARPGRWAAACGVTLALACTAHGAAYFLGLGALFLLGYWIRRGRARAAVIFVGLFLVLWIGITAAEWSLVHRSRTMPWSFLSRAFTAEGFRSCFGGPFDLAHLTDPSALLAGLNEARRWLLSLAPAALVAALAVGATAVRGWLVRRAGIPAPRSDGPRSGIGFLALSATGGLVLWATWNVWYGYPADWDVTAIAALTIQLLAVALLVRLPHAGLRDAALGFALPLQLLMTVELGARFTGLPG